MVNETLQQAFDRSQRRRAYMVPFLVAAILAGAFAPLYLPALFGAFHIGTMRDLGLFGVFLMPFAAVMAIGWAVSSLLARRG